MTTATPRVQESSLRPSLLSSLRWTVSDTLTLAWRNLLKYIRLPQLLIFSTIQPVMFVVLFVYVFGGAIQTGGGKYVQYLIPGILVQTVVFGGAATAIGLTEDLKSGIVDRFRSLPMSRAAMMAGRILADSIRNLFVVLLILGVGLIIGFRFQNGIIPTIAAIAIIILFGFAFSWLFAIIGLLTKDPETAQVAGFVWLFPLVFASSIFVPVQTMPHWLQTVAKYQPISVLADATRRLMLGGPTDRAWQSLLWIAGMLIVFVPVAVWMYRRTT